MPKRSKKDKAKKLKARLVPIQETAAKGTIPLEDLDFLIDRITKKVGPGKKGKKNPDLRRKGESRADWMDRVGLLQKKKR